MVHAQTSLEYRARYVPIQYIDIYANTRLGKFRISEYLKYQMEAHVDPQLLQNMAMLMSIT